MLNEHPVFVIVADVFGVVVTRSSHWAHSVRVPSTVVHPRTFAPAPDDAKVIDMTGDNASMGDGGQSGDSSQWSDCTDRKNSDSGGA